MSKFEHSGGETERDELKVNKSYKDTAKKKMKKKKKLNSPQERERKALGKCNDKQKNPPTQKKTLRLAGASK